MISNRYLCIAANKVQIASKLAQIFTSRHAMQSEHHSPRSRLLARGEEELRDACFLEFLYFCESFFLHIFVWNINDDMR